MLDEDAIERAGLGGLLGVNRGSAQPPRFSRSAYDADRRQAARWRWSARASRSTRAACRSRPADGMIDMKSDMGGAAAVLAAMSAAAGASAPQAQGHRLHPDHRQHDRAATPPGSATCSRIRNGKTVEVLNTDAEGRLVLADGLSLASEAEPDAIVDLPRSPAPAWWRSGAQIGRRSWATTRAGSTRSRPRPTRPASACGRCPLPSDYRKGLDSDIADLKNIGKAAVRRRAHRRRCSCGVRRRRHPVGPRHRRPRLRRRSRRQLPKGGTGFGVPVAGQLFADWKKPGPQ